MERYKPLPRMHGAGGPSSPRGGDADRNVSARRVKAARMIVAGQRHVRADTVGHTGSGVSFFSRRLGTVVRDARFACSTLARRADERAGTPLVRAAGTYALTRR